MWLGRLGRWGLSEGNAGLEVGRGDQEDEEHQGAGSRGSQGTGGKDHMPQGGRRR